MFDPDAGAYALQFRLRQFRPLEEADSVRRQVVLEQARLGAFEAVEIEMGHVRIPGVELADRERRARHVRGHAERAGGATHEGGLPRAELAAHEDDVAGTEPTRQTGSGSLRLRGRTTGTGPVAQSRRPQSVRAPRPEGRGVSPCPRAGAA